MTTTYTYASYHNELNPVRQSSIQIINQPVRTAECSYHCAAIQCYPTLEYRVLLIYPFLQTNITSHMWPSGGKGARNLQDLKDWWPWWNHWNTSAFHRSQLITMTTVIDETGFKTVLKSCLKFRK